MIPAHTAADMAGMVRSFTKWDAQPKTLDEALLAINRAYNDAVTPPMAPTLVVMDSDLQKMNAPAAKLPVYKPPQYTTIDPSQRKEIAKGLLGAENPRIAVGRLRTPQGVQLAIELAELVGASTSTRAANGPMSFPQRHPLCGPGASTAYDYTLGLEMGGAQAAILVRICPPSSRSAIPPTSASAALIRTATLVAEAGATAIPPLRFKPMPRPACRALSKK